MLSTSALTAAALGEMVADCKFRYRDEIALHGGIKGLWIYLGVAEEDIRQEVTLDKLGRIDFLLGRIGVEVKIKGNAADVWRQLTRYSTHPDIDELLLITTVAKHALRAPTELNGKPVHIHRLTQGL